MRGKPDKLRVGIVGCGRIAQTYLEALGTMPEFELVAVADERKDVAKSVATQYGCADLGDYRALVDDELVDSAIICTPPSTHAEIAGAFLDNGVHVLCEKPLTISLPDARTLVDKASKTGLTLMMASKFRYVDDVIKAKGILDSGILGDVILFENVFCAKVNMQNRWNSLREIGGGGVLIDNGTHSVDIARYLLGPIVKVQAEVGRRTQALAVEDTCRMYFRTDTRVMGAIDLSWSIHKERDSYIDVFGSNGVLSIGWKGSRYRQSEKLDWVEFGGGYSKISAFVNQLRNFAGTIRREEAPLITPEDGLESVRVIEAAYRSMDMDKWLPVKDGSEHAVSP